MKDGGLAESHTLRKFAGDFECFDQMLSLAAMLLFWLRRSYCWLSSYAPFFPHSVSLALTTALPY